MVMAFGLGIGAVLALLLAPRSGDEMRRAIADEVNRIRKEAEDRLGR
ncbi:MAG: YtxH domain-containing protein [Anaerolineae bacterium]|nr:YtxH domain-containing protein [Anaerolineae bacterium]